jgi:signal transduction histidine kinase
MALGDARRVLGILREPDAEPMLSPTPGESDISALVARMSDSGLRVSFVRVGTPITLPSVSSLALYRICQEAITNVVKHVGAGATVVVTENWQDAEVVLTITDEGRGDAGAVQTFPDVPRHDGRGQGIIGMRERAELVGGKLTSGPTASGGFRVRAAIPYELWEQ